MSFFHPPPKLQSPQKKNFDIIPNSHEFIEFLTNQGKSNAFQNIQLFNSEGETSWIYLVDYMDNRSILKIYRPPYTSNRETYLLRKIDHENVIKVYHTGNFDYNGQTLWYSLLEFFNNSQSLKHAKNFIPQHKYEFRLECVKQLISGLQAIYSQYSAHGDLHENNILITTNPDSKIKIKIIDPGQDSIKHQEKSDLAQLKDYIITIFFSCEFNTRENRIDIDRLNTLEEIQNFLKKFTFINYVDSTLRCVPEIIQKKRIYISSTISDLKLQRESIIQIIQQLNHEPIGFGLYPSNSVPLKEYLSILIDSCDLFLHISAGRYGMREPNSIISHIEWEFNLAINKKKEIIAFLHLKPDECIQDNQKSELYAFRQKIIDKISPVFWENDEILYEKVKKSLISHNFEKLVEKSQSTIMFLKNLISLNKYRFAQYIFEKIFRVCQFTDFEDNPHPIYIPEILLIYESYLNLYTQMNELGENTLKCINEINSNDWNEIYEIFGYSSYRSVHKDYCEFFSKNNTTIFDKKIMNALKKMSYLQEHIGENKKERYLYDKIEELETKLDFYLYFPPYIEKRNIIPIDIYLIDSNQNTLNSEIESNQDKLNEYFFNKTNTEIEVELRKFVFMSISFRIINNNNIPIEDLSIKFVFPQKMIIYPIENWVPSYRADIPKYEPERPDGNSGLIIRSNHDVNAFIKILPGYQEYHNFASIYMMKYPIGKKYHIICIVSQKNRVMFAKSFEISFYHNSLLNKI